MDSSIATRTPRLVEGVRAQTLPIGPEEAFVLSRIDGMTSESDIVETTGLGPDRVRTALSRLEELGAVRFDIVTPVSSTRPPQQTTPTSTQRLRPAIESRANAAVMGHPAAALYDPGELDEEVELDIPRKRKILDLYYRLDSLNHYELLSLDSSADKKVVKTAYYEAVGVFHPDRYFGKNLGGFKTKLEKVFARLTLAHDVLTRTQAREEYDQYLQTQRKNRDLERLLTDDVSQEAELQRARRRIEEQARLSERVETAATPPSLAPPPSDPESRRRALARKLGRSSNPARPSTAPPASAEQIRERVGEDLRRRYEQRLNLARNQQVERYVKAADDAIAEKHAVSAATALRIAVMLAPEDKVLADRLADVQQIASAELAQSYVTQAQYEERSGQFAEAAQSYGRAAHGKPNSRLHERAAHCLVEAHGDMKLAGEHAKKAVSMAPNEAAYRVTLARVYLAAGMKQSAQSELERAAALAPSDDTVKDWLKRMKRGDV